jgi:hypothetical protein
VDYFSTIVGTWPRKRAVGGGKSFLDRLNLDEFACAQFLHAAIGSGTLEVPDENGIPRGGPSYPRCGLEMNDEVVETARTVQAGQRCPGCRLAVLLPDPLPV